MQNKRKISKKLYAVIICLFTIILINILYLHKYYVPGYLREYISNLLKFSIGGLVLSFSLTTFISTQEKGKKILSLLAAILCILILAHLERITERFWFATIFWSIAIMAFFKLSENIKGIGRPVIRFTMIFAAMFLLAEPYISDTGLKWEAVGAFYLLFMADIVILMEISSLNSIDKKQNIHEYIIIAVINISYLIFAVCTSNRFRDILYSIFFDNREWLSFRIEALKVNLSGNPDAVIWGNSMQIAEMNLTAGMWLSAAILTFSCTMIYFMIRLHCNNNYMEHMKNYLCYAYLTRVMLSFLSGLFLITSSRINFPLLFDGEADIAAIVMVLFLYFYSKNMDNNS